MSADLSTNGEVYGSDNGDIVEYLGSGEIVRLEMNVDAYFDLNQPETIRVTVQVPS